MSSEPRPSFPLLEIASFVDATTVVLVGPGIERLAEDEELFILAVGDTTIPKTNIPLVVPKARLVVTFQAGVYAIARTPEVKVTQDFEPLSVVFRKTTVTRHRLTNDEQLFTGSPAGKPVAVGDPVVRPADVVNYIRWINEGASKPKA